MDEAETFTGTSSLVRISWKKRAGGYNQNECTGEDIDDDSQLVLAPAAATTEDEDSVVMYPCQLDVAAGT